MAGAEPLLACPADFRGISERAPTLFTVPFPPTYSLTAGKGRIHVTASPSFQVPRLAKLLPLSSQEAFLPCK